MDENEYRTAATSIRQAMVESHEGWAAADRTMNPYAETWLSGVVDRLVLAAGDEKIDYFESRGTPMEGDPQHLIAFTESRRIKLDATYSSRGGSESSAVTWSRRGLRSVEVTSVDPYNGGEWPRRLRLQLTYAEGVALELGGAEADPFASRRLVAFYPSLLADLDRP